MKQLSYKEVRCVKLSVISLVIRQKAKLTAGVTRKQSPTNFLKNKHFLPPDTHTNVFCFLETPVVKLALLPY